MTAADKADRHADRYFNADPAQRTVARELYQAIVGLPLVCPHGHVDPRLFADENYRVGSPTELLLIPDHYVLRMLYSQGITLESLGVGPKHGGAAEADHRKCWRRLAENFHLFRATPTGIWLADELAGVFGIEEKLTADSADRIYDRIDTQLKSEEFLPRQLYKRFNIEVLCTTDAATDTLAHHQAIRESGWKGRILPTFRPDAVVNLQTVNWRENIEALSDVVGVSVKDYSTFVQALEQRREFFKSLGAAATDHAAETARTERLSTADAEKIFADALAGKTTHDSATRFTAHMLMEMARMSTDDGLVMQLHVGSHRNHNRALFDQFGPDMGADIPVATEFTKNLLPLLNEFGNDARFRLIVFTLDESTYGRELAPLAGHYPAMKLGPPWWFFDSLLGMQRYFDQVVETAGIYNTAGFNDDTRAYPSIPARHDLWRRASADWLAGLVVCHIIDDTDAAEMAHALAYGLAKEAYQL